MKIEILFPRTVHGQHSKECEVAQVPREGESIQIGEDDGAWFVDSVIHIADPKQGDPVAQLRVK